MLDVGGIVVDIHPTPEPAHLEVATGSAFLRVADRIDDGSALGPRQRHAAADAAIEACVSSGEFKRDLDTKFTFHTYADTVDELLEFLETKWKQLHFDAGALQRARSLQARRPTSVITVTERVAACRLRSGKRTA
jgi:hypothetical protein